MAQYHKTDQKSKYKIVYLILNLKNVITESAIELFVNLFLRCNINIYNTFQPSKL